MKLELYGKPIRTRRLILFILLLLVLVFTAIIFLPSGLMRLAVLGLLGFPIAVALFDRPKWIFYILLIIIFSNLDIFAPFRLFRYALAFFIASFAVALVSGRKLVVHDQIFVILVVAFLIFAFQSLAAARYIDYSLYVLNTFSKVLINIGITTQFVGNRKEFRVFLVVLSIGVLLNSFFPFVVTPPTRMSPLSLLWEEGVLRYEGFALEANRFAFLQIFFIPVLFFLIILYRKPWFARPVLVIALAATISALIMTFSRGGFISFAFLLLGLLVLERRNRTVFVSGLLIIVLGIILAPGVYWERIASLTSMGSSVVEDPSVVNRLESMKIALRFGFNNPILGIGLGNFMHRAFYFVPYRVVVHNAFFQIFSEMGIVAFIVFIGILFHNLLVIIRLMRRRNDQEAVHLGRILFIQQFAVLVNSMFIPVGYTNYFWFALLMPTVAGYAYREVA